MDRKIIVTGDNSKTLLIPELNETYHSTNGALNEARHVFIEAGLDKLNLKHPITVFEMGFGTGLNVLVTLEHFNKHNYQLKYDTLEKYPLSDTEALTLDYPEQMGEEVSHLLFKKIHTCPWEEDAVILPNFKLQKIKGDIKTLRLNENYYDIVYFDAFGPRVQPNLWTVEVLSALYRALKPNGILVTYCAQGQFKRNLKASGFSLESLPGPPGKREMTRATKIIQS